MILDFSIRPLKIDDIQSVTQIEQASRPTPWSKNQFASELENKNSRPLILVKIESNTIVGYVISWIIAGEVQIQNLVVGQNYRGQGLGKLLLHTAISNGLDEGCDRAILEVRESNISAIKLYHQYQFGIVGRREGYYRDGETALLMTAGPFNTTSDLVNYREFMSKQAGQLKDQIQFQVE